MDKPQLDQETLQKVVDYAKLGFTQEELQIIVSNDLKDFSTAIQKGRLLAKAEVLLANYQLAKSGSSPAINLALQNLAFAQTQDLIT
jgi:hypothetical protein